MAGRFFHIIAGAVLLLSLAGCAGGLGKAKRNVRDLLTPTDVYIIRHHVREYHRSLQEFTRRLYAKNPKYENEPAARARKLAAIFQGGPPVESEYGAKPSHQVLAAAFDRDTRYPDRVYLLGLGLLKSVREAYGVKAEEPFVTGLQIPLERLQRLHHNISQVNWRLKTYRDEKGELLFRTNEVGKRGYINMGYEVIMTRILTRVEDDIYLRGGLPGKYLFNMSTYFLSIVTSPF